MEEIKMSEARKKAEELVERFKPYAHAHWDEQKGFDSIHQMMNAKQCALIAVDEIKNNISATSILAGAIPFWNEVRNEIENL